MYTSSPTGVGATAAASFDLASAKLRFEAVDYSNPPLHRVLLRKFHALCCTEFNESEMERLDVWERLLVGGDPECPYLLGFTLVYDERDTAGSSDNTDTDYEAIQLLGGTQQELYPASSCALLPYIVVSKAARGLGLSSRLVKSAHAQLAERVVAMSKGTAQLAELFIELSQKSDARDDGNPYHSAEAAELRHTVWGKIGFVGLEFSFRHPGYLRNTTHQLSAYRPAAQPGDASSGDAAERARPVPIETVLGFIRGLFTGILRQDGEDYNADEDAEIALEAGHRALVQVGAWR